MTCSQRRGQMGTKDDTGAKYKGMAKTYVHLVTSTTVVP